MTLRSLCWGGAPCFAAPLLVGVLAAASVGQQLTTLVETGPASNRVDMVFLGDGYTQSELDLGRFDDHIQELLDYKFTPGSSGLADPFPRYENFFNVHKIETPSAQSGADQPDQGVFVETALGAKFGTGSRQRLLTIDTGLARAARDLALDGTGVTADIQYASVNTSTYGGSGGSYAVYAGANSNSLEVALHEVGHSFAGLADEYTYGGSTVYSGGEPFEPNVTTDPSGSKWSHWIGYDDPRGSNLDIGVFEGGRYSEEGIYRPAFDAKMRSLNQAFHAVSREQLILGFYEEVDPIDSHLPSGVVAEGDLWVEVVDPQVIKTDWYVNDVLFSMDGGQRFDPVLAGLEPGRHLIRAHAYDQVVNHAYTGDALDLVRIDLEDLQQEVEWEYVVLEPQRLFNAADYNGDRRVDAADYTVWQDTLGSQVDAYAAADGDGSGVIDSGDLDYWRSRYGTSQRDATLVDATTNNGSFEETEGVSLPQIANSGQIAIPGWTAETTGTAGWHSFNADASSDGDVYALAAGGATLELTSDPLTEHVTGAGDLFTLTFDAGSNDGASGEYEAYLLFGEEEHFFGVVSEDQLVSEGGLATHTFDYVANPEDLGFAPVLRFLVRSGNVNSQTYLDNLRLEVSFWDAGTASLVAVPEPASLALLAFLALAAPRRRF